MTRRLLLIAIVATLLLAAALPGLPVTSGSDGSVSRSAGVAHAGDGEPTPTPTATPPLPDGGCQGGGYCGG
jgi:hypothetical protein